MSSDDDDDNCVMTGYLPHDEVILNGWMFCAAHGLEWCHRCCTDHRATNNIQIEDELTEEQYEELTDYGTEDLADREQIVVHGLWQELPNGKVACRQHKAVGCKRCFNFKRQILQQVPAKAAKINAEVAAFNAARAAAATAAAATSPAGEQQRQRQQQQQSPAAAATAAEGTDGPSASTEQQGKPETACWKCGKAKGPDVKLMKCGRCHKARYCSRECQVVHLREHQQQCKQWAAEAEDAEHS